MSAAAIIGTWRQIKSNSLVVTLASLTVMNGLAATRYVSISNQTPSPPYATWPTAATNIQDAIDVAASADTIVVSNGIYADGGRTIDYLGSNRVAVTKPLTLRSVNGPQFTAIQGAGQVASFNQMRCIYLTNGSSLMGFTLSKGTGYEGAGAYCNSPDVVVANCIVVSNSCVAAGGGVWGGTLNNCLLFGNFALTNGGAAYLSTLSNCTVVANAAGFAGTPGVGAASGGGTYGGNLYNCIAYFNNSGIGPNYDGSTFNNSCTTPQPSGGAGNIALDPLFADRFGGNLRLESNSPCINAGKNAYAPGASDLDGRPRITGGTVDMGAYEFQSSAAGAFIAWLQSFGLPTDGSADYTDPDGDGMNNWQEWRAQTNPTNALSALRLISAVRSGSDVSVTWQSVASVQYFIERSTNLSASPAFTRIAAGVPGQTGTTAYLDIGAASTSPLLYRVGVQ